MVTIAQIFPLLKNNIHSDFQHPHLLYAQMSPQLSPYCDARDFQLNQSLSKAFFFFFLVWLCSAFDPQKPFLFFAESEFYVLLKRKPMPEVPEVCHLLMIVLIFYCYCTILPQTYTFNSHRKYLPDDWDGSNRTEIRGLAEVCYFPEAITEN